MKTVEYIPIWLRLWCYLNKHMNFLVGTVAGITTGLIVFFINYSHGFYPALNSFFKQFAFNFLMGGFNTRMCEKLARSIEQKFWNLFTSTIVPTIMAFSVLFAIHYFGHTPKPGASTFWQFGANLIIFFCTALYYRSLQFNENQNSKLHRIQNFITEKKAIKNGFSQLDD